jgi:hypothetical protein
MLERGFAVTKVLGFPIIVITMRVKSRLALSRLLEPVPRDRVGK